MVLKRYIILNNERIFMKIIKVYFFVLLFMSNFANANEQKNYFSKLPHEMLSEILNNLDVESIINLKKTDTTLYAQVENYLNFKKDSSRVVLNGNLKQLSKWIKFLSYQENTLDKENNKQQVNIKINTLILNLDEDLNFYLNDSSYWNLNNLLTEIALKIPNLNNVIINKNIYGSYLSHAEVRIEKDGLYLKGSDTDIGQLMMGFYQYKKINNIEKVTFDLLKYAPLFNRNPWPKVLLMDVSYYTINSNTIYVNDVDNFYFSKCTVFTRQEVLDTIISYNKVRFSVPLIKEFKVVRNGVEEIYHFD